MARQTTGRYSSGCDELFVSRASVHRQQSEMRTTCHNGGGAPEVLQCILLLSNTACSITRS